MTTASCIAYDFATLRVVPDVSTGAFVHVGVLLHARTEDFLDLRLLRDPATLQARIPGVDIPLLSRYLVFYERIARGDAAGGPMAFLPPSERFHWLTAPRSDVLQSSPVHEGICENPVKALDELYGRYVRS